MKSVMKAICRIFYFILNNSNKFLNFSFNSLKKRYKESVICKVRFHFKESILLSRLFNRLENANFKTISKEDSFHKKVSSNCLEKIFKCLQIHEH